MTFKEDGFVLSRGCFQFLRLRSIEGFGFISSGSVFTFAVQGTIGMGRILRADFSIFCSCLVLDDACHHRLALRDREG